MFTVLKGHRIQFSDFPCKILRSFLLFKEVFVKGNLLRDSDSFLRRNGEAINSGEK